jgi:hypothetical protein
MSTTETAVRKIIRGANPFAPIAKLKNLQLSATTSKYEKLSNRANGLLKNTAVIDALASLKTRLAGAVYTQEHFGTLELISEDLIDINIDIQRFLEELHCANNIVELFDPRIMQPLNVIFIKETGRYSSWEGQQSGSSFWAMKQAGLITPGTKIQCKVVADDLVVPGSDLVGEAVGNYGFRRLGGSGRKPIDVFFTHRSRVNGVRLYNSSLDEDVQSNKIQVVLEQNHMFPAPAVEAQGQKGQPGMVTYISGVNNIANHDKKEELFEAGLADLEWALRWHDTYFANEKGVDGGFILAFGRLSAEARANKIILTPALEQDLYRHVQTTYGSPKGFHSDCKTRLKAFNHANNLSESWSDSCLTPILVIDYINGGGTCNVPQVQGMVIYGGI